MSRGTITPSRPHLLSVNDVERERDRSTAAVYITHRLRVLKGNPLTPSIFSCAPSYTCPAAHGLFIPVYFFAFGREVCVFPSNRFVRRPGGRLYRLAQHIHVHYTHILLIPGQHTHSHTHTHTHTHTLNLSDVDGCINKYHGVTLGLLPDFDE